MEKILNLKHTINRYGDYHKLSDKVLTSEDGSLIYPWIFNNWLKKVLKAAELEPYTLHSLRHTNVTMQIAAGVPLVTVSARAGHARTSTTTDIYAHFMRSSDQMAAETILMVKEKGYYLL